MKLATWNVSSIRVRLPQVLEWLKSHPVDVLCLQETKITDEKFPFAELAVAGYDTIVWQGNALVSPAERAAFSRADPPGIPGRLSSL